MKPKNFILTAAASIFTYGALVTVGPASAAPTLPLPPPSLQSVRLTSEHVVRPGVETQISIQTSPRAVCSLHPERQSDALHRHRLDADELGIVRVFARPRADMRQAMKLTFDCTREDGSRATYTSAVRADSRAPLTDTRSTRLAVAGTARPPLGAGATTLSDKELVARGFPRRPDKLKAPGAYAKWTYIVSHMFTAVTPRKVRRPDVSFAPVSPLAPRRPGRSSAKPVFDYNSSIWSGAVVSNPQVRFYQIQDDWLTPSAGPVPPSIGYAAVAVWAGLDNAGNDLVQTGTDSESWDFYGAFGTEITFTNYWAWIESLPDVPYGLPNFPVSPGDSISVDIFLADQYGNTTLSGGDLTPSDDSVWFMIYNLTTGNSYWGTLPRPPAFSGSTAEFVLERPSSYDTGVPFALANFGIVGAHDCYFADTWFGYSSLDYNGTPPYPFSLDNLTMFNGSNTLASSFTYANLSGAPGGGNELWVWQNYL